MSRRENSDETYILNLCDEILDKTSLRQHTFDFLRGDSRDNSEGKKLPVDAYYPELNLVIEYKEKQHTESVSFFDKKDRITVSGVHRGEQRKIYDERRRKILPLHGLELIELSYSDFSHNSQKKLLRNKEEDKTLLIKILLPPKK